jgi:hypothetical protein
VGMTNDRSTMDAAVFWSAVAALAAVAAAGASVRQADLTQRALEITVHSSEEASKQIERVANDALDMARKEADARIRPIVVVPPGNYVLPLSEKFTPSYLESMRKANESKLHPGDMYVNALPVKNYGGGPATGLISLWDFKFGCSGEEKLVPARSHRAMRQQSPSLPACPSIRPRKT